MTRMDLSRMDAGTYYKVAAYLVLGLTGLILVFTTLF